VIVVDVNLLLYAVDDTSAHHRPARRWWTDALRGRETVGLPWTTVLTFLRISTNPRVFTRPLTAGQALDVLDAWTSPHHVVHPEPTSRHLPLVRSFLEATGTAANLVPDAHLAALSVEHGARLCSADADFARFPGVRWVNPLSE
jgi:uncharacterized protein